MADVDTQVLQDIKNKITNIEEQLAKEIETIKVDNVEIKTNQKHMSNVLQKLADAISELAKAQADIKLLLAKTDTHDKEIHDLYIKYNDIYKNGVSICSIRDEVLSGLKKEINKIDDEIKTHRQKAWQVKLIALSSIIGWALSLINFYITKK